MSTQDYGVKRDSELEPLAKNLKIYRMERGWSQGELAEKSGVSRTEISYLESANPRTKKVTRNTIKLLELALGIHENSLYRFAPSCPDEIKAGYKESGPDIYDNWEREYQRVMGYIDGLRIPREYVAKRLLEELNLSD